MAHILVTDDSGFLRRRTIAILQQLASEAGSSHDIAEAADGRQCLDRIAQARPDVLILDLVMPEMDGFEVLKSLRQQGDDLPVIVLSADIQQSVREECLRLGAVAFVHKPPVADEVRQALQRALGD